MWKHKPLVILLTLILPGGVIFAGTQACTIKGSLPIMGQVVMMKDCMDMSDKAPAAKFRASCESLAQTSAAMGGEAGKVGYFEKCPVSPQGVCRNLMRSGMDVHYYERDAELLKSSHDGCISGGGTWAG